MGKKLKTGKQRKDKFYHLAKETGYRSRASFKLIQLNRKFEFLQKARVLIDLCAAPGGWLQVAHKYMPVSSFIVGIDLVSIKPIGNAITLQEDITTDSCRKALKRELKTWKADVILHDGAPNVGKSWDHDAFAQAQLTLSAVKIASEFLAKGGWFITKVFRSKDYNALIWVFNKLFRKVHATKPKASRTESAEIFVVCQGYIAPDKIDPKFLDPAYLFEDIQQESKANILLQPKKKAKAEGYPEGDYTLFHSLSASKFIESSSHIELLSKVNEVVLDNDEILTHPLTTADIKEYCKDIKVLGKSEVRALLKWRKSLRLHFKKEEENHSKEVNQEDQTVDQEDVNEESILKEAEEIQVERAQELKRKKKLLLKQKRKLREKMNLNMVVKSDEPIIEEDIELFKLSQIKSKKDLTKIDENPALIVDDPDVAVNDDEEMRAKRKWLSYSRDEHLEAWPDSENEESQSDSSSEDEDQNSKKQFDLSNDDVPEESEGEEKEAVENDLNPLIVDISDKKKQREELAAKWFDKDTFAELSDDDEDLELEMMNATIKRKSTDGLKKFTPVEDDIEEVPTKMNGTDERPSISQDETPSQMTGTADESSMSHNLTETPQVNGPKKKKRKLDVMGLALGSVMIQSKKMKRDIIDDGYNRYTFNDENLPDWFVKDEEKHYRKSLPVSAEMVTEYKERLKEINARPIKKVVEAKSRKKKRAMKKMEKARKKAEAVTESLDMTEKEKVEHIRSIYKKAVQKKEKAPTYVVAKKGVGRRVRRPPGVKGRFKMVDPRMKKDNKRMKAESKSQKGKTHRKKMQKTNKKRNKKNK